MWRIDDRDIKHEDESMSIIIWENNIIETNFICWCRDTGQTLRLWWEVSVSVLQIYRCEQWNEKPKINWAKSDKVWDWWKEKQTWSLDAELGAAETIDEIVDAQNHFDEKKDECRECERWKRYVVLNICVEECCSFLSTLFGGAPPL